MPLDFSMDMFSATAAVASGTVCLFHFLISYTSFTTGREISNSSPIQCLWCFQHHETPDPRDKVFGILNLLLGWGLSSKLADDYNLDTP